MNFNSRKLLLKSAFFLVSFAILFLLFIDLGTWKGLGTRYRNLNLEAAQWLLTGNRDVHQWRESGSERPYILIKEEIAGAGTDNPKFEGWKFNYYRDVDNISYETAAAFKLTSSNVRGMYISLMLLPMLILLTPTTWTRRAIYLVIGLLLLTLLHMGSLAIYAISEGYFRLYDPPTDDWWGQQIWKGVCWHVWKITFAIQGQLFSVGIWGLLCWRDVFSLFKPKIPDAPTDGDAMSTGGE